MSKRIVIALGGNALGNTAAQQLQLVTETARSIVDLIAAGNEVVVAHGNGPQVGMINLGLSTAAEAKAIKADMPFPECGAMSEGYIGYHLQQAIGNELASRGMDKPVATIVTQTVVSKDDPAFQNPTKPVGAFYDKETADRLAAEKGYPMVEDAGVPNVAYNGSTQAACPNTYIISSRINWAPYYEYAIKAVMDGTAIDADWTGTLSTNSVVLTDLNTTVAAEGTAEAIAAATEKLEKGEIHVFDCSTFTVKGEALTSYKADVDTDDAYTPDTEVVHDGYFSESEFRSAPYFDLQIDGINLLDTNFGG